MSLVARLSQLSCNPLHAEPTFWGFLVRICYGPLSCSPPVQIWPASIAATGAFTSRLPKSWSPFSPLDISTTATGLFCRWDFHPLE
jgi:hypothetical protein